MIDIWHLGNGFSYLYTDEVACRKLASKEEKRCATYSKKGKVFAWQFCFRTGVARAVEKAANTYRKQGQKGHVLVPTSPTLKENPENGETGIPPKMATRKVVFLAPRGEKQ